MKIFTIVLLLLSLRGNAEEAGQCDKIGSCLADANQSYFVLQRLGLGNGNYLICNLKNSCLTIEKDSVVLVEKFVSITFDQFGDKWKFCQTTEKCLLAPIKSKLEIPISPLFAVGIKAALITKKMEVQCKRAPCPPITNEYIRIDSIWKCKSVADKCVK